MGRRGWGEVVKRGKQQDGHFDDSLVAAVVEMIQKRWQPEPFPSWVTYVPSIRSPELVANLAMRIAKGLGLPFSACVKKVRQTQPQKEMENSHQQVKNLEGAFVVNIDKVQHGAVLLIDDIVDSRWTFTIIAKLL